MAKARLATALLTGCVLVWSAAPALAAPPPTVPQMLQFRPRQPGIVCTTPTPEEQAACKVHPDKTPRGDVRGWMLLDGRGQRLRHFYIGNAEGNINTWAYYKDGVEIYREIDTNNNTKPDQFRWLNSGGMKWGGDADEDGRIDHWRMISAGEAAQEVFEAAAAQDFNRLRALFITEAEMTALKLAPAEAEQIRKQLAAASKKFEDTVRKLPNLNDKAKFERAENGTPGCVPADAGVAGVDLIKFSDRVILFKGADGKHDWLRTGAMLQVGQAWRLLDAPARGQDITDTPQIPGTVTGKAQDPALTGVLQKIAEMDKNPPVLPPQPEHNAEVVRFYSERVALVDQVLPKATEAAEKEMFQRQLADNLSTLAQYAKDEDKAPLQRLEQFRDQVGRSAPGSAMAGYVSFRELWARFARPLFKGADEKIQREWMEALSKFVQQYPRTEDTPDALWHLGMGNEFGKEEEAKRWYQQLATTFPQHALAAKARGCVRRLDLVGKPLELSAQTLQNQAFNVASLRGKVVVVYYWTATVPACVGDFARLKQLQQTQGSKGVEIVTVSLDERAEDAARFVQTHGLTAPHLFQSAENQTGLNCPLALQYGINTLPTLILIGKDGNVISRTLQINDVEEAVRKAL